jgi:hypothetical protein
MAVSTKRVHLGRVFMSVRNAIVMLVALSASALLAGCGSSSSGSQTIPPPAPPPASVIPTSLNGTYVISYSGMDVNSQTGAQSPFAMLGTITANGNGALAGVIDLNDLDLIATTGATSGVQTSLTPTGTYTIGDDGRGTGTLNFTINGTAVSFGMDFVLISSSHGLITRFDSSGSGSGTIDLQPASVPANSFQSLSFALFGADANGFPLASAGAITVNSSGVVTGTQDFNENGYSTGLSGLTLSTATSNLTEVNGSGLNGTAELDSSFGSLSFEVWVIDQTHLKFIESDTSGTVLYGDAFTQQTSFPAGQLVLTLGGIGGGFRPFVAGGLLTTDASGNMNGFEDFNYSGSFTHVANVGASCTPLVAGRCQLAFTNFTNGTANNFQFAAYPTSGGILLLEIDSFGLAQGAAYAQTFTSFAASQSYGLNFSGYNGGEVDDIAQFAVGTSSISPGTLDENDQGKTFAAEAFSGTYTPSAQAPGRGSITATVTGSNTQQPTLSFEYYVIDSSTIAIIETDASQVGLGTFQLQNVSGATPLAQSHVSVVRPIIQPRAANSICSGSTPYGTCPAPAQATQVWCVGNNPSSTCTGGTSGVNFTTTTPAAVSSPPTQFEGLDAVGIFTTIGKAGVEPDPNGSVGPSNSSGVGQYLEFADNNVQAFDKSTGNGIFTNPLKGGIVSPQPLNSLFAGAPSSSGIATDCSAPALDGIASYDRIDNVFVLTNIFNIVDHTGISHYYLCLAVSSPTGSTPASNLEGLGGVNSWNVYEYDLNLALPLNSNPNAVAGTPYFPDYLRFGTWSDGFYASWDLEDSARPVSTIVGFEACQIDKAHIIAGLSSNPLQCYTYLPSYAVGAGTGRSLIHTALPADFEGDNPIPGTTAGEYFLALVNPRNLGSNDQCTVSPCTSNQLAFWTWSGLSSGAPPTFLTLPGHTFTPGCYSPSFPYDTYCIPEPPDPGLTYPWVIDGLGDRLAYRLAYRYITGTTTGEYLAVTHTVQENNITGGRTGIRYYKILAGTSPQAVLVGDIQDPAKTYFLSMPSVAMDKNGDLGITYTQTGNVATYNYDPSPFFVTVDSSGNQGTPVAILGSNSGMTGVDGTDENWGEYVSVNTDPDDDLTFWAVDEYMNGPQVPNQFTTCSLTSGFGRGCTWASIIFTCQKGSGC